MNSDSRGDAQTPHVVTDRRGTLAVIRINRPEQRNSLSASTLDELEEAFQRLAHDEQIRAVVFTGTGDVFASGADIRELGALTPESALAFAERGQRFLARIAGARRLTIAAVNGYCMGGGLDLALACHIRVASPGAVFAHPGARLGVITGWGGTQKLPRLVGSARALEMFATARRVGADEALEIGLVSRLHEDPLACALEIASRR
jgi:enoyl-CoA hydratase/carnithine racemase